MSKSVTAIIPTQNRSERLDVAIRSVLRQTHDEITIAVVDGGSTDRTPEVVEELRKEADSKDVKYIRNETPQGLPAARNMAAEHTESDYLAFLDDDDEWHRQKIERQLKEFKDSSDQVGAVYTGFRSERPDGTHLHTNRPKNEGDLYEPLLVRNVIGPPSTVMMDRDPFKQIDGFDETLRHQEDWDFYLRLARDYEFRCVAAPLITRLVHREAMSSDIETQKEFRERILRRNEAQLADRNLKLRAWAAHHRKAGIMYCRNGDISQGRNEFRHSLEFERDPRTIILCCSMFFGRVGFNLLVQMKRQFVTTFNVSV